MCGFVGFISKQKDKDKIIKEMNDTIVHRGPDSEGYYVDDNIAMGFRRLSIIDLAKGTQPIFNEDKTKVITFNGEIYNYQELRKDLIEKGHQFKTNSDTETILHGYEEYKEEIVLKLRGMFAFTIYDIEKNKLFGARDYFGIKPFYYYNSKDCFIYGSEIKSFLKNPLFKKEMNKEALKTYLTFQYSALDETFFKGVYRLKPGEYFIYENNKLEVKTYFTYEYTESNKKLEEITHDINEEVKESVKYHQISDVKVGAFLSGGVDSSYIVSEMMPDTTYSVGFDYEDFNETNDAKDLSDILGIKNKTKMINDDEFLEGCKKVQYYSDEPHANLSAVPLYYLSKLAREDVKVVLSGEGADELYGGYLSYKQSKILMNYRKLPKSFRKFMYNISKKMPNIKGKSFLERGSKDLSEFYIGQAFIMDDEEANSLLKEPYKTNIRHVDVTKPYFDKVKDLPEVTQMQYVDMHLWLPLDILLKADKMTMANSLELRVPFLDKEVYKQALTVPAKYKVTSETTKYAFREASKIKVPLEWAKRVKKGFPVPYKFWLKSEKFYNDVKQEFTSSYAKEFFNTDKLLELLDTHYNGVKETHRKVYTIYCFLLWYKQYFVNEK